MYTRSAIVMVFIGACLLITVCSTDASATSDIGFKGIGPRLGFVDPQGSLDGTVEFGVAMEFGEIVRQLHWDGSVSFWSSGRHYNYYDSHRDYFRYDWTVRDIILRSGVNYHFVEGPWVPYAGGGLGLHFFSWDYNGAPYYNNNSDTKLGLYIDGGIEHDFSRDWKGQVQLQFDFADPDQTALMFNLIYRLK
jgi:opacity protein-like surface antigen